MNFIIFIVSKFRIKLSSVNHLIIRERTKFDPEQKPSKFLLAVMTLVSSGNNIGSDVEFMEGKVIYVYYEQ